MQKILPFFVKQTGYRAAAMDKQNFFSIIISGHHPFVTPSQESGFSEEERDFFESISDTWLPLLELFETMEREGFPFQIGMVLSSSLCDMFQNNRLMERYLEWLDKRILFGSRELKRCAANKDTIALADQYYKRDCWRKTAMTEQYNMDLLAVFSDFQKRGRLEILITSATQSFLPFYVSMEEAIRAQIETALIHHRKYFNWFPQGFWLPELGWTEKLGDYLVEYGIKYTIANAHALILGDPPAENGFFSPVKSSSELILFGQDSSAAQDLENALHSQLEVFRSSHDVGYEISAKALKQVLDSINGRCSTGYCYWAGTGKNKRLYYNPLLAEEKTAIAAKDFLKQRLFRLETASQYMENPISIWTFDADTLLRSWHEGTFFLKTLIKEMINSENSLQHCTPGSYLNSLTYPLQQIEACYSSSLENGYAEPLLDASNDWIYRHIFRSVQRMAEMTERFSEDTGLKERALNQAARELLFAQNTDWSKALNPQYQGKISREYAQKELLGALRNFTTIYEALGSGHISTEWLTSLERKHNFLPHINHRVFGRKK